MALTHKNIIYVVDDDASVCRALTLLLSSHGFKVETFSRAAKFLEFNHPKVPSCLVLDINMPDLNGLALQEIMAQKGMGIPIIFITGYGSIPITVKTMKAGATDFLPKPFAEKDLLKAIENALSKSTTHHKEQAKIANIIRRVRLLTPRELEVFLMVAKGMLSKQIAFKRGTALQTIKVHRGRVMQKMQAKTVTELIHLAQQAGLVSSKR